jgi:hypothetical protein
MLAKVSTTAILGLLALAELRVFVGGQGDDRAFLEGVRDRLERDVDARQLQDWVRGVVPNVPQKVGFPIHLPHGETVPKDLSTALTVWEDGSFCLPPGYLPTNINALFPDPPSVLVRFDPNPAERHVEIGFYGERFGLVMAVGSTNFVYDGGMVGLKWRDGIYVSIGGGG